MEGWNGEGIGGMDGETGVKEGVRGGGEYKTRGKEGGS